MQRSRAFFLMKRWNTRPLLRGSRFFKAVLILTCLRLRELHRSIELGKAQITTYYCLAYGRVSDSVPGPEFRDLILAIARQPGGFPVGLEMVSMRLHSDRSEKRQPLPEVREAGRFVLAAFEFQKRDERATHEDHELGVVVAASLIGEEGALRRRKRFAVS